MYKPGLVNRVFKREFKRLLARLPNTLFFNIALRLTGVMLGFTALLVGVLFLAVVKPMAEKNALDQAAFMALSVKTWVELPPNARADFAAELALKHGVQLRVASALAANSSLNASSKPFLRWSAEALTRQFNQPVVWSFDPHAPPNAPFEYWTTISLAGHSLQLGIAQQYFGQGLPKLGLLLLALSVVLALAVSVWVVRNMTQPLARMVAQLDARKHQNPSTVWPKESFNTSDELMRLSQSIGQLLHNEAHALHLRTVLLSGVSHDLRTPLTRLQLALELLPSSTPMGLIESIARDLTLMNQLIGEFVDLGRDVTQSRHLIDQCDLNAFVQAWLEPYGTSSQIVFKPFMDAPTFWEGNALALKRVLSNLLDNALRYAPNQSITVALNRVNDGRQNGWQIAIADLGPGIPAYELDQVFEAFYRLERSRNTHTGGSGLGLAVVKALANANGWQVRLQSHCTAGTCPSQQKPSGTVAKVFLPTM